MRSCGVGKIRNISDGENSCERPLKLEQQLGKSENILVLEMPS